METRIDSTSYRDEDARPYGLHERHPNQLSTIPLASPVPSKAHTHSTKGMECKRKAQAPKRRGRAWALPLGLQRGKEEGNLVFIVGLLKRGPDFVSCLISDKMHSTRNAGLCHRLKGMNLPINPFQTTLLITSARSQECIEDAK